MLLHPENLRRGKSCKCNIRRILGYFILSNLMIQIVCFFPGPSVVPEDCRADNFVLFVQSHQTMHLSTKADSCNLAFIAFAD